VSHPSLGLPPRDLAAGRSAAAAAIRAGRDRLAARALETALDADPTLGARYDELGLRRLLHDTTVLLDQVATAVAAGDPSVAGGWAEQVAPLLRRRRVPMDDLIALAEGGRRAVRASLPPDDAADVDAAVDAAIASFRWHRRIAGDARRRNRLLDAIYKGA
jgi:hypothetical protein